MPSCPICTTESHDKYKATPYWVCPNCACWFQWPQPPKTYIAGFEGNPANMSEGDKQINKNLAGWIFNDVMKGKTGRTLDIGAKLPVFASALLAHGCDATGIDGTTAKNLVHVPGQVREIGADFEDEEWIGGYGYDLISLIHTFEHLYNPLKALRRLRVLIRDSGRLYIRLPQHNITGFERDLTDGHYSIHPFYHSASSLLEILAQTKDCFALERYLPMHGSGQSDVILRPISHAPSLSVGVIARNEERDLPKLLDSLHGVADRIVLVDTGSTDLTTSIAVGRNAVVETYTEASEQVDGQWRLTHFSKARNRAIELAENLGTDWYAWFDADDVLVTPAAFKRQLYREDADVLGAWIDSGGYRWIHHRLWRTGKGIRFKGRCHEYAVLDGFRQAQMDDVLIRHDTAPGENQENSNDRNLRLLMMEWEDEKTSRTAFYLGNTHKDAGRWQLAADWYAKRLNFGEGFLDEYLFACLYRGRALRELGQLELAKSQAAYGRQKAPGWAEFIMLEAQCCYDQKDYIRAIYLATSALDLPITPTVLWREPHMYKDQPARLISWCHEHLGNIGQAIVWAELAAERIGEPDIQWTARIGRLHNMQAPRPKIAKQKAIALCRPGAIGDILMTLNLIPALRDANPDRAIWYFCDEFLGRPEQLGTIMRQAGVDQVMDCAHWDNWKDTAERAIQLVGYPLHEGYPDKPMAHHLLDYFAKEMGLPERGPRQLTLQLPPKPAAALDVPYVTWQPSAGWSKYKEWRSDGASLMRKWHEVFEQVPFPVKSIEKSNGYSLHESIGLFANARMHIGIDSFCNHLTHYRWVNDDSYSRVVPGVILWGSTQYAAAGYPNNINIAKHLPCQPCFRENPAISRQPRGPCINPPRPTYDDDTPHACMEQISVEEVVEAVRKLWESVK